MKIKTTSLVLFLLYIHLSFSQTYKWVKGFGSKYKDEGNCISVDKLGNVYLTGYFFDRIIVDDQTLVSSGYDDVLIAKFDSKGNCLWIKKIGGKSYETGKGISVDLKGNVYIIGDFYSKRITFAEESPYYLYSKGKGDVFIAKYDTNGNFIWAKRIGGNGNDEGEGLFIDLYDNIYITGCFSSTVRFGDKYLTSAYRSDIFFVKIDKNGKYILAKSLKGRTFDDKGLSISVDKKGNIYITGYFFGTVDFDPDEKEHNLTSSGYNDIFIAKYDSKGKYIWAKKIGGKDWDAGHSIYIDDSGNIYITGSFQGTVDFDPGEKEFTFTSMCNFPDIFLSKYDTNGNFLWTLIVKSGEGDGGNCIVGDSYGNIYCTGGFRKVGYFDKENILSSKGEEDIFIAKIIEVKNKKVVLNKIYDKIKKRNKG